MPELFSDTVNQMSLDYIQQTISEHLFDEWNSSNCDEGMEYSVMEIAKILIKKGYKVSGCDTNINQKSIFDFLLTGQMSLNDLFLISKHLMLCVF